jgi:hypothetical protein
MKTIVCEQPGHFALVEEECPMPGVGEALVRIRRIGICGTDLHAFQGNQPFFNYPRVLGHELSGVVEKLGESGSGAAAGAAPLHVGDKVAIMPYLECGLCLACLSGKTNCCTELQVLGVHRDGGMREFLSVPVDHLIPTPNLSLEQGALVEPLSIGAHAVRRAQLTAGETVLVIGAGPIGLATMKFAKLAGANVIAMDINDERLAFCRRFVPADHTVNALHEPFAAIEAIAGGDLPTVVFDATGNAKSMMNAFTFVSHGGKLVYVGLVKADITFHDPDFHKKELTLLSSRNATREDFQHVIRSLETGAIDDSAYITHTCEFDVLIDRFPDWLKPETGVIKGMAVL